MNLMTLENISKSYTEKILLDHVDFSLNSGEKVGVIGINGTGKSTLLKIVAGLEEAEEGTVTMGNNLQVRYLPQTPVFDPGKSILSCALEGNVNERNRWDIESQAKAMLQEVGITEFSQPAGELSGGQRKRAALVKTLLSEADILVLDEPTNHLDSEMSDWLEQYLKAWKGALVMVTHDRYFLDSVTNRIVEIDKGKLYSYQTNYSGFLERKAEREEIQAAAERKRQSILRTEIAWMMRGARARSTKQKAHIERYEKLRDMEGPALDEKVEISSIQSRLGRTTVELSGLSKAYGDRVLFEDYSYIFLKDDRIGIVGPNGCGKSTLMKIIMGLETPTAGSLEIGQTVRLGYFSQENEEMDLSLRVIDYIRNVAEYVQTTDGSVSASVMLERFLFPADLQYTVIGKLSGGERRRLYLLRVLMDAPNVLLLDEPTNDLDIQTLMILEDYLDHFPGIVITVSHDRYFLDRICRRIFSFEGKKIVQYEGGYTDYQHARQRKTEASEEKKSGTEKQGQAKQSKEGRVRIRKLKFSYQEQRDYETIEEKIAGLEEALAANEQLTQEAARDYSRLNELMEEKEKLEKALEEAMERWMYLEDLAARIEAGEISEQLPEN